MASMRASVSSRRSASADSRSRPASRSSRLAASSSARPARIASADAVSARLRAAVPERASPRAAARAPSPSPRMYRARSAASSMCLTVAAISLLRGDCRAFPGPIIRRAPRRCSRRRSRARGAGGRPIRPPGPPPWTSRRGGRGRRGGRSTPRPAVAAARRLPLPAAAATRGTPGASFRARHPFPDSSPLHAVLRSRASTSGMRCHQVPSGARSPPGTLPISFLVVVVGVCSTPTALGPPPALTGAAAVPEQHLIPRDRAHPQGLPPVASGRYAPHRGRP